MTAGRSVWRLKVALEFSASHQLRGYQGKCEALHGHNFGVEAEIEGDTLTSDTGLLMDFGDLKAELKEVLKTLDHAHLNDLEPFCQVNPSSENLARHIYRALKPRLVPHGVRLASVSVSEKPTSTATYSEMDQGFLP